MIAEYLIPVLIWMIFTYATTRVEAVLFHYRNEAKVRPLLLEHFFLTIIRMCVLVALFEIAHNWILMVVFITTFSFFHDGWYYMFRNKITPGVYPRGFFDASDESTAWFEFTFLQRAGFALAGILSFITYLIIT